MAVASSGALFDLIAEEAARESQLWAGALRPPERREPLPVFSPLVSDERLRPGVETVYEGYLLHFGRSRLFEPADADTALLLGDYLYAHGLVRVAATGDLVAVDDLAELISLCAQSRAETCVGEPEAWAATSALLGSGCLDDARRALCDLGDPAPLDSLARSVATHEAVERAYATHASRVR